MKKFAIILSGCGVYDGSEIHEAVMAMLAITRAGAEYHCFAPDINQHHVINHLSGEETNIQRNVLEESARIARGQIHNLAEFDAEKYEALVIPGGYGAAKNLSSYAFHGADMQVNPDVAKAVKAMHTLKKPIGAMCIAPVILGKLIENAELTIGQDEGSAANLTQMGAQHKTTANGEVAIDENNRLVTTPCYMLDASIADVFTGEHFIDIRAVSKGKGMQGPVKRAGVKMQRPKAKKRRIVGSISPWNPSTVMWQVPRPGQMGYHSRTEYNKN